MPLIPIMALAGGLGLGWWSSKETVEAVTGGDQGKPPYLTIIVVLVALFIAWRKGWLK
jgi:hypothetical protein